MTSWPASRRLADIGVRLLYVGAAIAMTWVMALRYLAFRDMYRSTTFGFPLERWLLAVGAGALVGVLVGLALRPVVRMRGYRWGVALALGLPPLLLLATIPLWSLGRWIPPTWVVTLTQGNGNVLSVMVGVAITAGLTSRGADPPREDRDRPSDPGG